MDSAIGLIILAGVMLIGSFLAGSIPIVMNMSNVSYQLNPYYDLVRQVQHSLGLAGC